MVLQPIYKKYLDKCDEPLWPGLALYYPTAVDVATKGRVLHLDFDKNMLDEEKEKGLRRLDLSAKLTFPEAWGLFNEINKRAYERQEIYFVAHATLRKALEEKGARLKNPPAYELEKEIDPKKGPERFVQAQKARAQANAENLKELAGSSIYLGAANLFRMDVDSKLASDNFKIDYKNKEDQLEPYCLWIDHFKTSSLKMSNVMGDYFEKETDRFSEHIYVYLLTNRITQPASVVMEHMSKLERAIEEWKVEGEDTLGRVRLR